MELIIIYFDFDLYLLVIRRIGVLGEPDGRFFDVVVVPFQGFLAVIR